MTDLPSRKKKKRGGKIDFHGYIDPVMYDRLSAFRDPDAGNRWESALMRRIIREWLDLADKKKNYPQDSGGERSREELQPPPKKSDTGQLHAPRDR
jgi:hypothetical protein